MQGGSLGDSIFDVIFDIDFRYSHMNEFPIQPIQGGTMPGRSDGSEEEKIWRRMNTWKCEYQRDVNLNRCMYCH